MRVTHTVAYIEVHHMKDNYIWYSISIAWGGGARVGLLVSTATFHARVRGSFPVLAV